MAMFVVGGGLSIGGIVRMIIKRWGAWIGETSTFAFFLST
jgi:hypothetical protein